MRSLMKAALLVGAALATVVAPSMAQATDFQFSVDAGGAGLSDPLLQGNGTFSTAGDTGTFTLGNGLTGFSFDGVEAQFVLGGYFSLTEADLAAFSVTLDHGAVTALDLASNSFTVNQWLFGFFDVGVPDANVSFISSGLSPGNFSFTTDVFFTDEGPGSGMVTESGNLTLGAVPEPASWALMLGGFGLVGAAMRRRHSTAVSFG